MTSVALPYWYMIFLTFALSLIIIPTGRELSMFQQYTAVGIASFPLFWIAGAGAAVFWVIGMLLHQ